MANDAAKASEEIIAALRVEIGRKKVDETRCLRDGQPLSLPPSFKLVIAVKENIVPLPV